MAGFFFRGLGIFLGMDGFEHGCHFFYLAAWYRRPNVAIKMHYAALPLRFRIELGKVLHQTQALVGYEQLHSLQAALLQLAQEVRPATLVLFGPFAYSQDLPITVLPNANRHQYRDVLHFTAPAPLQPQSVQKHIGKCAHQRPLSPLIDLAVNLLVQIAYRGSRYTRAP